MRSAEIALLLMPPAVALLWWFGGRRASWRLLGLAALTFAALATAIVWLGLDRAVTGRYVPARLEHGRVVEGHGR